MHTFMKNMIFPSKLFVFILYKNAYYTDWAGATKES